MLDVVLLFGGLVSPVAMGMPCHACVNETGIFCVLGVLLLIGGFHDGKEVYRSDGGVATSLSA